MENNLKYLVLGYRKYTGTRQRELAEELEVPIEIVTSLETGIYRHPTKRLISKIKKLTAEFDQHDLIHIGRGYRIHDELGPDFKYFLRGLEKVRGINPNELKRMPSDECYRIIGSVNMDEFEVMKAGIQA